MSLKDLFKRGTEQFSPSTSLEKQAEIVESAEQIEEHYKRVDRYLPDINYSKPEEFVRFGIAEQYYKESIQRIYKDYPYDGSLKEKIEYENKSTELDIFMFNNLYPRTTGYAVFAAGGWGLVNSTTDVYNEPVDDEFIEFYGGPHSGNVYNPSEHQISNLAFGGENGNTLEFWLNKGSLLTSSQSEVVLDVWVSGSSSGSADWGKLTVETYESGSSTRWFLTYQSGSDGAVFNFIDENIVSSSWNHYAFSLEQESGQTRAKYYRNGSLLSTSTSGTSISLVSGSLIAHMGALVHNPSGSAYSGLSMEGWGKLSGSIDEFRFWRKKRTSEKIGRYWFDQVGGGTNSDTSNTDLGVYYKFNEGISTYSSLDSAVLDYSGRMTNGVWTGYTSSSRNTGSAIVSASAAVCEWQDPIVYSAHPDVVALESELGLTGREFDFGNPASLYQSFPNWLLEDDCRDDGFVLRNFMQICTSYLDSLHILAEHMPNLHFEQYPSGSNSKPSPFVRHALASEGIDVPELFVDATILEKIQSRNDVQLYKAKVEDIKNQIYQNIFNNLNYLYKSKGTEKVFRNLLHCFGIDESLVKINLYANNATYEFKDQRRLDAVRQKFINFNDPDQFASSVYQYAKTGDPNTRGFLTGSTVLDGFTSEVEVFFPKKFDISSEFFFHTPFITSSIYGVHEALDDGTNTSWASGDGSNFQVYALKEQEDSPHVRFMLSSSLSSIPTLTTDTFKDVYDNERWVFAVKMQSVSNVSSSLSNPFTLEFQGVNYSDGIIANEFYLTSSVGSGSDYFSGNKRFYVGAHRTDFTGSLLTYSDLKVGSLKYWHRHFDSDVIRAHAKDTTNYGTPDPYLDSRNARAEYELPQVETLALNWGFFTHTGSDSSGQFVVEDVSSGSEDLLYRYGDLDNLVKLQHTGRGDFFVASSTASFNTEYIVNAKQKLPEVLNSADMIQLIDDEDAPFSRETRPITYQFVVEKSMYQTISEEMLNMFSSMVSYNSVIGDAADRYRPGYSKLDKLRMLFFEKVQNDPDLERYVEFYKWIDNAITEILGQFVPASMNLDNGVRTIIESHILERNKYNSALPTIEYKSSIPEAGINALGAHKINWKFAGRPLSDAQNVHCDYWKYFAERDSAPLSSSNAGVNADKVQIQEVVKSSLERSYTTIYCLNDEHDPDYHVGYNIGNNAKVFLDYTKFGSQRYLQIESGSVESQTDCNDFKDLKYKEKLSFKVEEV